MNEAETRAEHIDPAVKAAGWGVGEGSRIGRETLDPAMPTPRTGAGFTASTCRRARYPTPEELWALTFAGADEWRDRFAAIPFEDKGGIRAAFSASGVLGIAALPMVGPAGFEPATS
jgi:hypothetical protein